jgi:hypothetical protein
VFSEADQNYLIRNLGLAKVVLFLGAGFSSEARNRIGTNIPLGRQLATLIWDYLKYDGDYDNTSLQEMYEAMISTGLPHAEIADFLESRYIVDDFPKEYAALDSAIWYRIYSTNIDDLVEKAYHGQTRQVDVFRFPEADTVERDQSLSRIQLIKLNGGLPCRPSEVTFSVRQYASRANEPDPLYAQFVRDYSTHPTIFLGSELNEPLFWQYIALRDRRQSVEGERRPKSFLIAPKISEPRKRTLPNYNIVPIEGTAVGFLTWLGSHAKDLPSQIDTLKLTCPGLAQVATIAAANKRDEIALEMFGEAFERPPVDSPVSGYRSPYLMGATPVWADILSDFDAERSITVRILDAVAADLKAENAKLTVHAILGSAGSGKSTILKRAAVNLARSGWQVWCTNSEVLPRPDEFLRALDSLNDRIALVFDNAEIALGYMPSVLVELQKVAKPPVLIFAARTNDYDRTKGRFLTIQDVVEHHVPNLDREEIVRVLDVLERTNLLGNLRAMVPKARIHEFEIRAQKQILVAMREATSGQPFDKILKDEFEKLVPQEAKILYLCVALATDSGFRISTQQLLGCSSLRVSETLNVLERNLRDIVIKTGISDDRLLLRHRSIAEFAVDEMAPRGLLREAYIRLLGTLADAVNPRNLRSSSFRLYRALINHFAIYRRFEHRIDEARAIYDALADRFKRSHQFWLQYGSLELEGENLDYAKNYLDQAESLSPRDLYVATAQGHLVFRRAIHASTKAEALKYLEQAQDMILNIIEQQEGNEAYAYHIYCSQTYRWLTIWSKGEELRKGLEPLREMLQVASRRFSRDRRITELAEVVERVYLGQAVV